MFSNIIYISFYFVTCLKKVMKKLLLITLLGISLNSYSQYSKSYAPPKGWKSPELYLPATILISTYSTNSYLSDKVTYGTRTSIAFTGMATSIITHFVFRSIRKHKQQKSINVSIQKNNLLTLHK